MKRIFALTFFFVSVATSHAQIPVVDVANLTETISSLAELRHQVRILLKEVSLSTEIKENTQFHLNRYERALTKRGVIPTQSLGKYLNKIKQAHHSTGGALWENLDIMREMFPMYKNPTDPVVVRQHSLEKTMSTLEGVFSALQVHNTSVDQGHDELVHMKGEIIQAIEPQQMRDVQANLQIVHARELLLTRQAIATLTNLEALRTADEVSQKAQHQMRYMEFVGNTHWVGNPERYDVKRFLR